jgi:lipoyl(octanoyl) transferase
VAPLPATAATVSPIRFRELGPTDYATTLDRMRAYTRRRIDARDGGAEDPGDEIWTTSHAPVFTLGRGMRRDHLHETGEIPVVETERGGHVTYHGPGQLVAYPLLDLSRRGLGVRRYVCALEAAVIAALASVGIVGRRREGAPGIYVGSGAKIASIGLKVSYGFSYHGLALNVAMDLAPFHRIDPCGHAGLAVTDVASERGDTAAADAQALETTLRRALREALQHGLGR